MIELMCSSCGQDHAKPLVPWCDRSDLEIQCENLLDLNSKCKKDLAELKAAHFALKQEWATAVCHGKEKLREKYEEIAKQNGDLKTLCLELVEALQGIEVCGHMHMALARATLYKHKEAIEKLKGKGR